MIEEPNLPYPTPAGPSESLNVYLPHGPVPPGGRPVLIAIHGGGWRRLDKAGYGDRIASAFVPTWLCGGRAELHAVGSGSSELASQPGGCPIGRWPGCAPMLTRWASIPNEVAAIGESAGANLAALLGTDPGPPESGGVSTQVEAVIAFSTPTDLSVLAAESPLAGLAAAQFLGERRSRCPPATPRPRPSIMSRPAIRRCFWYTGWRIRSYRSVSPSRWPPR